jgi:membrane fusion protein, multidrug efflux system
MTRIRFILIGMAVISLAFAGCGGGAEVAVEEQPQKVTNVAVYTVVTGEFEDYLSLPVVVSPYRQVNLGLPGGGRISALSVDKGDRVREGALMLETDTDLLRAQLDQARANSAFQEKEITRARKLHSDGSITDAALDGAELALASARTSLAMAEESLDNAVLEAPFSGTVTMRFVEVGDILAPGTPAFRLIDVSRVKVQAGIPEKYIAAFTVGSTVSIGFDAFPGSTFDGTIDYISPEASPEVRTFLCEIVVPNPDGVIRAGIMGNANILRSVQQDAMMIPLNALIESQTGRSVFVDRGDGTAEERHVTLGKGQNDIMVVVEDGVRSGERIILQGQHDLVTGELINITGELTEADIREGS